MADALFRRPIFDAGTLFSDPELTLTAAPPALRLSWRAAPADAAAAGPVLGLSIPLAPLTSAVAGERAALWLGPDEWLLLDQDNSALAAAVRVAISGKAHALVDVSHRQTAIEVTGRLARRVLSSGCPLDLHEAAFPVGMVARTIFHKTEIILWRREGERFHIEIARSFAPYVRDLLIEARQAAIGL